MKPNLFHKNSPVYWFSNTQKTPNEKRSTKNAEPIHVLTNKPPLLPLGGTQGGLLLLLFLLPLTLFAQQSPDWQWAKAGGGQYNINGSGIYGQNYERILEVATDANNNYYFLAEVGNHEITYDGQVLSTYNHTNNRKDTYVFSTDCMGNLRWDKMIGGGASDYACSLGIDAQGNVYVSGQTYNYSTTAAIPPPPHFDTDTIKTTTANYGNPDPMFKVIYLIKYDSEGNFQWLREPEGIPNVPVGGFNQRTIVEPNGRTHSLMRFWQGTHLNGQLTVPEGELQSVIVKYDADGNLLDFIPIEMETISSWYDLQLVYDANLDRYYIADTKRSSESLSIDGYGANTDASFYLAAVDNQGNVIWYHEPIEQQQTNALYWSLGDLRLDDQGNIYITGLSNDNGEQSFAGYEFTQDVAIGSSPQAPFLIKLDSDGNLIWGTNPDIASRFPGRSIAFRDGEVLLGLGLLGNTWDGVNIDAPLGQGYIPDPFILRFDPATGQALGVIQMPEQSSTNDQITSIAVDTNNNIIAGGYFGSSLFDNHPLVPPINSQGGDTDFFIAQWGGNCDDMAVADNKLQKTLRLYPNPATNSLHLKPGQGQTFKTYTIYNLAGQSLQKNTYPTTNKININNLAPGLYFLKLTQPNGQQTTKQFIKE